MFELNQAVFWDPNPIPIKYLMRRLGVLPTNEHRLPMVPATPELEARLDALLERAGLSA
jgi:4-hydroxy-tetrahydrodipicolinate synthase